MSYRHLLLAVDLTEESDQVAERAVALATANDSRITLIHVIEPLSFAYGGDVPMDLSAIQDQLDEHAQNRLNAFADKLSVKAEKLYVVSGHTETEIHRIAKQDDVDLIVVGSHGRHGLSLLLGSTANGVLHGASCDVLAVRVHAPSDKD